MSRCRELPIFGTDTVDDQVLGVPVRRIASGWIVLDKRSVGQRTFMHYGSELMAERLRGFFQVLLAVGSCNALPMTTFVTVALALGCDRTEEVVKQSRANTTTQKLVSTSLSPRTTIQECIAAYGRLNSYEDTAFVRLLYTLDGKPMEDRAPLAIAWDSSGNLGIRAYSIQAGPNGDRWHLRIDDPASPLAKQVVSRAVPPKVDFAWLLDDPVVSDGLAAGLAGFPPQLDVLLSPIPLEGLASEAAKLQFQPMQHVEGRACHVIRIENANSKYVLWIDQASMLIRRIHLPNNRLPKVMLEDSRVSEIQLTIEMQGVRTNQDIDWAHYAPQTDSSDQLVNHFVPPPISPNIQLLNRIAPAFELSGPDGKTAFQSAQANRQGDTTVLVWLANHPACRAASEQLKRIQQGLPESVAGRTRFVSVWAEPSPPTNLSFGELSRSWSMPGSLVIDRQAMGRDVFGVAEAPTIVVLDDANRIQLIEARANPVWEEILPNLLGRLAAGENVAADIVSQSQQDARRFKADLAMARAVDSRQRTIELESYQPAAFRLREVGKRELPAECLATTVDAEFAVWHLLSGGRLVRTGQLGAPIGSYQTTWNTDGGKLRIQVSPQGKYVACAEFDSNRLEIFDTQSERNRVVGLGAASRVRDFRWITFGRTLGPRLGVVTGDRQSLLLDPTDREQLSGRCPADPCVIIMRHAIASQTKPHIVLADGSVEALELPEESTAGIPPRSDTTASLASSSGRTLDATLTFQPMPGPWSDYQSGEEQFTLARGWLARDEAAVFLLQKELNPQWHFRMPLRIPATSWPLTSVAKDPATGLPVWVVVEAEPSSLRKTIHLFRSDGLISDHFRVDTPVSGVALQPLGDKLNLQIASLHELTTYEVVWH